MKVGGLPDPTIKKVGARSSDYRIAKMATWRSELPTWRDEAHVVLVTKKPAVSEYLPAKLQT
jgi:hypothetical protein